MKYIIDTSSLISLDRYYLHFDKDDALLAHVKSFVEGGQIMLVKAVQKEFKNLRGMTSGKLSFLQKHRAEAMIPAKSEWYKKIDEEWCARKKFRDQKKKEYEAERTRMIKTGDFQLIFYVMENRERLANLTVVSEESEIQDRKAFKKIPLICREEDIRHISLPQMLEELGLSVDFGWSRQNSPTPLRL